MRLHPLEPIVVKSSIRLTAVEARDCYCWVLGLAMDLLKELKNHLFRERFSVRCVAA
jgi:hypothetical protein